MLLPVDTARFWRDNAASRHKPFRTDKPQVPMTLSTTEECLWEELGLEPDPDYWRDVDTHVRLNRLYNDKAEEIVGRRLLPETWVPPEHQLPRPLRIEEVFGSTIRQVPVGDTPSSDWVEQSVYSIRDLEERLERVESLDLRAVVFPEGFSEALARLHSVYGLDPQLGGGIRGPVTAAMSVCGVENVILWLLDYPVVMKRFRDLLAAKIIELCSLLREATGATAPGFGFSDDNCAMLNPDLYERFGLPILEQVFAAFAPREEDWRFQHSDSEMTHLLALLNRTRLHGCNFGPTVRPERIRAAMPRTVIQGQLPPWTFARGTPQEIADAVRRDIEAVGADGGLEVTTAGSVNAGSRLEGLRAVMYAIQTYGRYQPLD